MKTATIGENITITGRNQEHIAFVQTIDFEPLFEHVRGFTKVDCEFSTPVISLNRRGYVVVDFVSEELSNQVGLFAAILKECRVRCNNTWIFNHIDTGELVYSCSVSVRFAHKDSGANSMEITNAVYNAGFGWTFYDAGVS